MNIDKGVLVGCDADHEWMLKWWWENYSKHNTLPVTFFDFGMSKSAHLWCAKKGTVISLSFPQDKLRPISPSVAKACQKEYLEPILDKRPLWFVKPLAILKSPYETSLWVDIDCEVRKSIIPLFDSSAPFRIVRIELKGKTYQNSGVIVAKKGSEILAKWAENALARNHEFQGDDDLLVATIRENPFPISFFSMEYNYPTLIPGNENAAIRHHVGTTGKWDLLKSVS